jgi:protein SCO1/2
VPSPTPPRHRRRKRITDARVGVALVAALGAIVGWAGCGARPLPVLGTVPAFTLTDHSGAAVGSTQLAGGVWIADFIFTRCPDVCPALTARMAKMQAALPDDVRLVSFSVDPTHDTPEVLRAYASRAGARDGWLFLTGPRAAMATLLREGFRVAYADDGPPTAPITHSDRFVLIDRELRIRGYYHGDEDDDLARLTEDAAALHAGRVS